LQITLDRLANDGAAGEGDNVWADVENVRGGAAGDTLIGDDGANALVGKGGSDQLTGSGGADTLISGGDFGTADSDTCGSETDTALVDGADLVGSDCENVILGL
jgi:Ca2+-binding RTX toxin-like protein